MKLDIEKREGLHRLLIVHIPAQEMAQTYNTAWKAVRSTKLRGFRHGKFPKGFLAKQFKARVESEFYHHIIPHLLQEAEKQYHLNRVTQAQIEEILFEKQQPLECKMSFEVRPEFSDLDLTQIEVALPVIEISDEEKQEYLESMLQDLAHYEEKQGSIQFGDFVTIDWKRKEGEKVETQEDQSIKVNNSLSEQIRNQLIGMQKDETKAFAFTQKESTVEMSITVKKIDLLKLPELTEDVLQKLNMKSIEEVHQSVNLKIHQDKERTTRNTIYPTLREQLAQIYNETAIPETFFKQKKNRT